MRRSAEFCQELSQTLIQVSKLETDNATLHRFVDNEKQSRALLEQTLDRLHSSEYRHSLTHKRLDDTDIQLFETKCKMQELKDEVEVRRRDSEIVDRQNEKLSAQIIVV